MRHGGAAHAGMRLGAAVEQLCQGAIGSSSANGWMATRAATGVRLGSRNFGQRCVMKMRCTGMRAWAAAEPFT